MEHFPIFLNLQKQRCLVVGGGLVAERKVRSLLRANAEVQVIAPSLSSELQRMLQENPHIHHQARGVLDADINGFFLVIAATNHAATNEHIAQLAHERRILVNVVDNPPLSSFIMPAVVDRSPVTIAISTGGASPVLARQLKMSLETMIPASCGELAAITERYRERVKQQLPTPEARKAFWERALKGPFAELVYAGQIATAEQHLDQMLIDSHSAEIPIGEVYLVGAGPGDPDLLSFRAFRLMQQADVVIYDRLVAKSILDKTNADAERLYVGKEKANHAVQQHNINELLIEKAKQGKRVLRLKGGDPFIFGRGGEEIETLAEHGIPFQVVPAVTAAVGCACYAGIPLTHRDYAQSCIFTTGHLKDGSINLDWEKLASPQQTLVFYMGLTGIGVISEQLIQHGMPSDMPAALIEQGTTRNQRVHIGTLATLAQLVQERKVRAPTLTIVGEVVKLHNKLQWYQPERHVTASEFSRHIPEQDQLDQLTP